jgi:peptidoglycan/LPS O-acetylase OafA/YrhL
MDLSYGIYIYAFLITQILIELYPALSSSQLIALVLITTIPVSLCSWIFIESKALAKKKDYYSLLGDTIQIPGKSV